VYPSQSFAKHENALPEFYYVLASPRLCLFAKVSLKITFVRELQEHVKAVTMYIAAVELDDVWSGS
jgi:hypothetical protein